MIQFKELKTKEDFINIKKGDILACEFHKDVHDYPKKYRFKVFTVAENNQHYNEIILQKKNNIYFNWQLFIGEVEGSSNLKCVFLLNTTDWFSVNDKNNPIPNDGNIEIKFRNGSILDYDDQHWPFDEITHWRYKDLK